MARVVTKVVIPNAAAARVDHTYLKRGVYYFNRRVPLDVSRHYKSRRINFPLHAKSVCTTVIIITRQSHVQKNVYYDTIKYLNYVVHSFLN